MYSFTMFVQAVGRFFYYFNGQLTNFKRLLIITSKIREFEENKSLFCAVDKILPYLLIRCVVFITVTRRVKGYIRFVGKYVTGGRKRFRPHTVYIFLIRITSRVDLAMSVCPYERSYL